MQFDMQLEGEKDVWDVSKSERDVNGRMRSFICEFDTGSFFCDIIRKL